MVTLTQKKSFVKRINLKRVETRLYLKNQIVTDLHHRRYLRGTTRMFDPSRMAR